MNRKSGVSQLVILGATSVVLTAFYLIAFYCLNKDLKSIFDEGFFFLLFKPREAFTAYTQPLSLGGDLLKAFIPGIDRYDILSLRRVSFFMKILGLAALIPSSIAFIKKHKAPESSVSYGVLVSCILLFGLIVIPSVVVGVNDELLFFEMIVLSLGLSVVLLENKWIKAILICLIGMVSFLAMLCNAPGGGMLFLLTVLFVSFYPGFHWAGLVKTACIGLFGMLLGVGIMHWMIVPIPEFVHFFKDALTQTANTGAAAHHSLAKLIVGTLLNVRDLVITVVSLLGITYVSHLLGRYTRKGWVEILTGLVLFAIYFKWQVKPGVGFSNVMTWLFLMTLISGVENRALSTKDWVLMLFLFLLPFGLSMGSNLGFLYKAKTVNISWGILLFFILDLIKVKKPSRSSILFLFVFALIMMDTGRYLVNCLTRDSYRFAQERPIARMHLSKPQYDFYNEVYDLLDVYGYKSQCDTLLGFCFNEMTVVALDAVPYTNDQYPEEFLLNQAPMSRPPFLILGKWDKTVLSDFMNSLGWKLEEDYDAYPLKTMPDPDAGYDDAKSTLYCLKTRKRQE